jgi:hypothetical protein
MNDEQKIREAIERDEAWFAEACHRSEPVDTDAIKQRVRIEIGEQWLGRKLTGADDSQLSERIRGKVRVSLANSSRETDSTRGNTEKSRSTVYRFYWAVASAVGIAATLFLTLGDLLGPAPSITEVSENVEASYADAFEQYEGDDWDTSFGKLSAEFDSFASGAATADWGSDTSDGWFDTDGGATDG